MKNNIKKLVKALLAIGIIVVSVYPMVNATNSGVSFDTKKATLPTGEELITVIASAKNVRFNDFNMSIKYDQENLIPAEFSEFIPVETNPKDVLQNLEPIYLANHPAHKGPYGWVRYYKMGMDASAGTLNYHIEVNPRSKGVKHGSDAEGFIPVGPEGLPIVRFSFLVKENATITKDSIQLLKKGMPGYITENPYGMSMTTDAGRQDEDLSADLEIPDELITAPVLPPQPPENPEPENPEPENPPSDNIIYSPYVTGVTTPVVGGLSRFTDVAGHWAEESIINVQGMLDIYSEDQLIPQKYVTKAEVATILCEVLGLKESKKSYFTDIEGHLAQNSINTLYYAGIVSGELDRTYRPDSLVEREELATMLSKAIKFDKTNTKSTFVDDEQISDWAKEYIYSIREKNILNGYPDGTVRPRKNVNRAEMAVIIDNLVKHLKNS